MSGGSSLPMRDSRRLRGAMSARTYLEPLAVVMGELMGTRQTPRNRLI